MDVNLEIRHLKLLAAVAEEGSITGASRRLHLTQSALSHQLRDAEQRLGAALFLRLGKKMSLTAAGQTLLESARVILQELKAAEAKVLGMNGETRGAIRMSTECYTCYHWLPPVVARFHARYPKVDVNIDMEATHNPGPELLAGKLDLAVMSCPPQNRSVRLSALCEDELVVVTSTQHRLATLPHVNPEDLEGETLLVYPPRQESTLLNHVLQPAGIEPHRVMEIPLTEAIVEMAAAGVGVAFLARWAVAPHILSKKVAGRSLGSTGFRRTWYAVTLRSQPMTAYLEEFLSLLALDTRQRVCGLAQSMAAM